MKFENRFYLFLILITLFSCKEKAVCLSCDRAEEMRITGEALDSFYNKTNTYYSKIETAPNLVIRYTDSILLRIKNDPDTYSIRWNKLLYLSALRAETFYKNKEYQKAIDEVFNNELKENDTSSLDDREYIYLACNYIKLKKISEAKRYLDKANVGYYITNYIRANYYEVVKNKNKALETYSDIINDKSMNNYEHYHESLIRINELNKPNPEFLNELFYPSSKNEH